MIRIINTVRIIGYRRDTQSVTFRIIKSQIKCFNPMSVRSPLRANSCLNYLQCHVTWAINKYSYRFYFSFTGDSLSERCSTLCKGLKNNYGNQTWPCCAGQCLLFYSLFTSYWVPLLRKDREVRGPRAGVGGWWRAWHMGQRVDISRYKKFHIPGATSS